MAWTLCMGHFAVRLFLSEQTEAGDPDALCHDDSGNSLDPWAAFSGQHTERNGAFLLWHVAASCAIVAGMISGTGGLPAIVCSQVQWEKFHAACSTLHIELVEQMEWGIVFHEQQLAGADVDLIP